MTARTRCGLAILMALAVPSISSAQTQQIEWKQITSIPKGHKIAKGVSADILGIEIGDTFEAARAKVDAIRAESLPTSMPVQQGKRTIYLPGLSSGSRIEVSYPALIVLSRELKGSGTRNISENIKVVFSAPSSGHQVVSITRLITYHDQADQPPISQIVTALKEKFKGQSRADISSSNSTYAFIFDEGNIVQPPQPTVVACGGAGTFESVDEIDLRRINQNGTCDVVMKVDFSHGISNNHASSIRILLTDQERGKANFTTDFAFFNGYIRELQNRTRGAAPKL